MRYKIGVLAKQFGVSPQLLRFYEKEGLLPAHTDQGSATRHYSARNFKWLFSIRRYYTQGFSTEEIKRLFLARSPEEISIQMTEKEAELRREAKRLTQLADQLSFNRTQISGIADLLEQCREEMNPEFLMIINQRGQSVDDSPEMLKAIERWTTCLPYIHSALVVDRGMIDGAEELAPRQSGFVIEAECARGLGLSDAPPARWLAPRRCLHTVAVLKGAGPESLAHCAAYMRAHDLVIDGDPIGRCLVKVREENCRTTQCPDAIYYEYWIPIKPLEK